jgi:hypothetical protein
VQVAITPLLKQGPFYILLKRVYLYNYLLSVIKGYKDNVAGKSVVARGRQPRD